MNLYEFEGKDLLSRYGIATPNRVLVRAAGQAASAYRALGHTRVLVKAQVLSGKRAALGGIRRCASAEEVADAAAELFAAALGGFPVAAVLVEEELALTSEHYLSLTYDTSSRCPVFLYGQVGGSGVEQRLEAVVKEPLDIRQERVNALIPFANELWQCFKAEDTRLIEVNPLAKTVDGRWIACDAKVALDPDAGFRHDSWAFYEPRGALGRLLTQREKLAAAIDSGPAYYRGTAGKYIDLDGDIGVLFAGGGASIANMDALAAVGLTPANYCEYSGNPPREKVHALAKVVLSKPGLRGLWIVGGVANFTSIVETFAGVVDALEEVKPSYPIVVRRAGPQEKEGMELMAGCAARNGLRMQLFGKETSMSDSAAALASCF